MNLNLGILEVRQQIIKDIKSNENCERKLEAFERYEVYNNRIKKYVKEYLLEQLDAATVKGMPIISCMNIAQRVVKREASIYSTESERVFAEGNEDDQKILEQVYEDGCFDSRMQAANECYKLNKGQVVIQPILLDKKVQLRVLYAHQFDVIPDVDNPEKAYAYILSGFDKSRVVRSDGANQMTADRDDYKASLERYTVWTEEFNFTMNGKGEIISEAVTNDIGALPFVDLAETKDGEFFIRPGETDTDFTIQYNAALSDFYNIVRLQGYAQAVYTGNAALMPTIIKTGPTYVIRLPIDPQNPTVATDFKYVTPSPDLEGSIKFIELLVANYLTTRGIDTKAIAGTLQSDSTYASGTERLLAMIERFEASKEDVALFKQGEQRIFDIVKAWLDTYSGTEFLDQKYWVSGQIVNATISVNFSEPQSIKTESEELADLKTRMDMGIADRVTALMELKGMDEDQAIEYLKKLDERKAKHDPLPEVDPNNPQIPGAGKKVVPQKPKETKKAG